jgi:hypothetical protein
LIGGALIGAAVGLLVGALLGLAFTDGWRLARFGFIVGGLVFGLLVGWFIAGMGAVGRAAEDAEPELRDP